MSHPDSTRFTPLLLAALLAFAAGGCATAPEQQTAPRNDSIREQDLRADLFYLAGDHMEGRRTQTRGNALAAEFIASRFERLGLEPVADGSYFQRFELVTASLGEDNAVRITVDGAPLQVEVGDQATPMPFSGSGSAEGEVFFAGHGIASQPLEHDDYAGRDVDGRIVLVMDHEPGEDDPDSPFDGRITSEVSRSWRKALAAQKRGAAGILFVHDAGNHEDSPDVGRVHAFTWEGDRTRYSLASWVERIEIPAARISVRLAEEMMASAGTTLGELTGRTEAAGGASMELPGVRASLMADVERTLHPDRNVVGMIRGSDPELADEAVLLCAHYDHDGRRGERIFNGADDDGSGTVGLIEIAEAYALAAADGDRPRRSILFAAWNSEEVGLLGAWAYTEDPIVPLRDVVATINMDMIGRNEEVPAGGSARFRGLEPQTAAENENTVHLMGYSYSSDLRDAAEEANETIGLTLEQQLDDNVSQLLRRSDHWPFLQLGVPALFVHTGLHPDYHRDTDTPERINYPKMTRIVRFVHTLSWDLAQQQERPALDAGRQGVLTR